VLLLDEPFSALDKPSEAGGCSKFRAEATSIYRKYRTFSNAGMPLFDLTDNVRKSFD